VHQFSKLPALVMSGVGDAGDNAGCPLIGSLYAGGPR